MAAKGSKTNPPKSATRRNGANGKAAGPDALTLLRSDHSEVSAMFQRYEKGKDKMSAAQKAGLAGEICTALSVHAEIEEAIFYPALRPAIKDDDLMDEAVVEHGSLKELIAKIEAEGPRGDLFDAHVKVLGEYVKHHVEEEQNEMFKKARKTGVDMKALGAAMQARKQELMAARG